MLASRLSTSISPNQSPSGMLPSNLAAQV